MKLRELRKAKGMTMKELGDVIGVAESTISQYETGKREPDFETMLRLGEFFSVSVDYLMRGDNTPGAPVPPGYMPLKMKRVPLVGRIACGEPITAEENIEGYVNMPEGGRDADFALRCEGDSMIDAGINDGDVVFIRCQPVVENGEIAAVRIDCEATLKRVYLYSDRLVLQPANSNYAPMVYTGPELDNVHIEGKAVGVMHWY